MQYTELGEYSPFNTPAVFHHPAIASIQQQHQSNIPSILSFVLINPHSSLVKIGVDFPK
jgi:hypothetical protein